ncbi:MAG: T9SS type A sorting domain-containing protein [Chitinophagales bacterium]|nr:T9SS type A sorting domain-containing protein [Chitinophagales bacterium]
MKTKYLLLGMMFFLLCANTFAAEIEPNDTKAKATKLNLNGSNTGAINPVGDVDWWQVATTSDGQLNVTLTSTNGLYCYVTIYDNNGTTLLASNYTNGTVTISKDGLAPGTYFIYIYPYYSDQMPSYTLSNVFTPAALTNDPEPNDTYTNASNLPLNKSKTGHIGFYYNQKRDTTDFWKITTTGDGLVRLSLTSQNGQYVYYQLFDADGITNLHSSYTNGSQSYDVVGLAAGTYYVKIFCFYSDGFAPYTLTDSLIPPVQANDPESNDSKKNAVTLNLNSTVTGHIGYYANLQRDMEDWYKVTTNKDGMISITFTSNNNQYVYAYLYDNDGSTLIGGNYTNGTFTFNTDGLMAGTYYVKIFPYYSDGFAPYTLTNSLSKYANADDGISNDVAKKAATLPANTTTPGHVGFYYKNSRDLIDWWKINYTGNGDLTVTMNVEPWLSTGGVPYSYLQIYEDTLAAPIFNQYNNSGTVTATLTGLSKKYYYVAVFPFYNTEWFSYNLTPTFTQKNCASISLVQATSNGCSNSSLEYQASGSHAPYSVQLYRYGKPLGSPIVVNNGNSFTFDNLAPGNYYATVYGDGATGSCSSTTPVTTIMPVIKGETTSGITSTKATLKWNTISCVVEYSVQYRVEGTSSWTTKTTNGNVNSYQLKNLTPSTTYEWRVAGVDMGNGETATGKYSSITTFTTLASKNENLLSTGGDNLITSLYPNPVSDVINLSIEHGSGQLNLSIVNNIGQVMAQRIVQADAAGTIVSWNVSEFPQGIYLVRITNGTSIETRLFNKQ